MGQSVWALHELRNLRIGGERCIVGTCQIQSRHHEQFDGTRPLSDQEVGELASAGPTKAVLGEAVRMSWRLLSTSGSRNLQGNCRSRNACVNVLRTVRSYRLVSGACR